jgi:hypothetical protein
MGRKSTVDGKKWGMAIMTRGIVGGKTAEAEMGISVL